MNSFYVRAALGLLTFLTASPVVPAAEPLGRLFFSPEQRKALDQQAQADASNNDHQGKATRFDGKVLRGNGRNTYWINGQPLTSAEDIPPQLQAGEAVDTASGEKRSLLGNGALRIHSHRRQ